MTLIHKRQLNAPLLSLGDATAVHMRKFEPVAPTAEAAFRISRHICLYPYSSNCTERCPLLARTCPSCKPQRMSSFPPNLPFRKIFKYSLCGWCNRGAILEKPLHGGFEHALFCSLHTQKNVASYMGRTPASWMYEAHHWQLNMHVHIYWTRLPSSR